MFIMKVFPYFYRLYVEFIGHRLGQTYSKVPTNFVQLQSHHNSLTKIHIFLLVAFLYSNVFSHLECYGVSFPHMSLALPLVHHAQMFIVDFDFNKTFELCLIKFLQFYLCRIMYPIGRHILPSHSWFEVIWCTGVRYSLNKCIYSHFDYCILCK